MRTLWISMGWMATDEEFLTAVEQSVPEVTSSDSTSLEALRQVLLERGLVASLYELGELAELYRRHGERFRTACSHWSWRPPPEDGAILVGLSCCDHNVLATVAQASETPDVGEFLRTLAAGPVPMPLNETIAARVRTYLRSSEALAALQEIERCWINPDRCPPDATIDLRCSPAHTLGGSYLHTRTSATGLFVMTLGRQLASLRAAESAAADELAAAVEAAFAAAGPGFAVGLDTRELFGFER